VGEFFKLVSCFPTSATNDFPIELFFIFQILRIANPSYMVIKFDSDFPKKVIIPNNKDFDEQSVLLLM
jgi:hypothetical protein